MLTWHVPRRPNPDIFADLFPEKSAAEHEALAEEKEARFRQLASRALTPLPGLRDLSAALTRRGIRRAAVTNAPRANVRYSKQDTPAPVCFAVISTHR